MPKYRDRFTREGDAVGDGWRIGFTSSGRQFHGIWTMKRDDMDFTLVYSGRWNGHKRNLHDISNKVGT